MVSKPLFPVRRRIGSFFVLAAAAVATGCGDNPSGGDQPPRSTPETATAAPMELIRTVGTVVTGDEPGCLLLDTGTRRYHLVGGAEATLEVGQEVTVTGLADPNTASTCAQATPLTIEKIDPAE